MSDAPRLASDSPQPTELADHLFRTRAGQMVAYLTRLLGPQHLDIAEEAVQESLLRALQNWPYSGVPQNPVGWLFHVARNAALDAIRHRQLVMQKSAELLVNANTANGTTATREAAVLNGLADSDCVEQLRDDELRMVLMCCHPALPRESRVALSLKTVGGLSTREIARAFLTEEATIAQRLVRAKRQLRDDAIAFDLPSGKELALRLDSALEVIYLMFNEGYTAQSGEDLIRQDLCGEALRLATLLTSSSVSTSQVHAVVALMAFQAARLPARVDASRELVLLEDQDRSSWDRNLIALGFHHFGLCAEGSDLSPYHIQAAIAAAHAGGPSAAETNWANILDLYDELMQLSPSPVVALNRAVAVAKVHGAESGLAELRALASDHSLRNYYLLPAAEGRLRMEIGDHHGAAGCFRRALELPCSEPEKRFLRRKLAECA